MTNFLDVISKIPGLTHYYELTKDAKDSVGTVHGTNHGCTFGPTGAVFNGSSYIEIPDNNDFSVATKGGLTVLVFMTVDNWKGAKATEYVNWFGKAANGTPAEWCFRHYCYPNGTGEAAVRPKRTSFYHFNYSGGLGAGSFFQDDDPAGQERVVVGTCDLKQTQMFKNGVKRDSDLLSGYNIKPQNTNQVVRLGSKDLQTGFLVGRLRRVAFWNRVLTDAEIKAIYTARNEEDGGTTTPPPVQPPVTTPPPTDYGSVTVGTQTKKLNGVNVNRGADQLIQYTPSFGAGTKTNAYGFEAAVVNQRVTSVESNKGGMAIPPGGYVLSGHGTAATWLSSNAVVGAQVLVGDEIPSGGTTPEPVPPYSYTDFIVTTPSTDVDRKHNALVEKLHDGGVI